MIRSHARESTIAGTAHRKHALLASAAPTPAEPETATARAGHSPRPRYSGICLSPSRGAARDKAIALPFAGWRLLCLGEITNFAAIRRLVGAPRADQLIDDLVARSEEHTSELQSLMRISYAVFCLTKKNNHTDDIKQTTPQH